MNFEFKPKGVCSSKYSFEIDESTDIIKNCKIVGGCPGNLLGISKIIVGMKAQDVIDKFAGTKCGFKSTSCPDQIAVALKGYLEGK